jgi:Fe-S cluster assembly protein SufD
LQGAEDGPLCRERGNTLSTFTVDAAAALAGPDWLRHRRVAAAERLDELPWPTTDEEVWRYSRVDDFDLDDYHPLDGGGDAVSADEVTLAGGEWERALAPVVGDVLVVDGRIRAVEIDPAWQAKGVVVGALADADGGAELFGTIADAGDKAFAALHEAFVAEPVIVRVPRGLDVEGVVQVRSVVSNRASGSATFPHLVVELGEAATLSVVEIHESADEAALVVPVTELHVGASARLGYTSLQELGLRTWQIAHQASAVDQQGTLVSAAAALGGDYARLRTDCRLVGRGATGTLLAAYFGEGDQMLDFRTFQDHRAPDTTSSLLFKGAVAGSSRSVYTGLIRVRPNAHGTNAFQTNRNIKLSEDAWAESVPNLEIENNDVRCSHASAVGPVDEEQRFYLESRGVPPHVAERLVVAGFFDEVLDQLPTPAAIGPLRKRIEAKLDRRDEA